MNFCTQEDVYLMCINLLTNIWNVAYNKKVRRNFLKQRDLIKKLENIGFRFERHGGNHDIYSRGNDLEKIPRHKEINERLARAILRKWGL